MHSFGISHSHWVNKECHSHDNDAHPVDDNSKIMRIDKVETVTVRDVSNKKLQDNVSSDLIANPEQVGD